MDIWRLHWARGSERCDLHSSVDLELDLERRVLAVSVVSRDGSQSPFPIPRLLSRVSFHLDSAVSSPGKAEEDD